METKEIKSKTKPTDNFSKEIKQNSFMSKEEFLKDTISFDEFKTIFAKKMNERLNTNLYI